MSVSGSSRAMRGSAGMSRGCAEFHEVLGVWFDFGKLNILGHEDTRTPKSNQSLTEVSGIL